MSKIDSSRYVELQTKMAAFLSKQLGGEFRVITDNKEMSTKIVWKWRDENNVLMVLVHKLDLFDIYYYQGDVNAYILETLKKEKERLLEAKKK